MVMVRSLFDNLLHFDVKKGTTTLFLFVFCILFSAKAQSPLVDELSNATTVLVGSFLDNPNHHSNTIKVHDLIQNLIKTTDEIYYSNNKIVSRDLPYISNVKSILKCSDFITANIVGYSRGGIDATEWETFFNPIMSGFGWTWEVIYSTPDIVFYEYKKDSFRMVLAKNVRPKKEGGDYNANSFSCYVWIPSTKEHHAFLKRIVFGGDYQFVEYGDDETRYKKISKVTSKRGTSFD